MQELNTFKLIERINTLMRSEERRRYMAMGLQPIHVQVLDYLQHCNRHSDTPASVAEYFSLTKGTVSQSLQVLERKGYIVKKSDADDGRVVHLALSDAGSALLEEIQPLDVFAQAEQAMLSEKFSNLEQALTAILTALQQANKTRSFGVCHSCVNFIEINDAYHCNLTQLPLSGFDAKKICREHILRDDADDQ